MPVVIDTFEALPADESPRRSEESRAERKDSAGTEPEDLERMLIQRDERAERVRAH